MSTREGLGRTALVTGASAGIGAAFARVFARHGFDLALTARREDRLRELGRELREAHGVRATVVPGDLSKASTPERIFRDLSAAGITVDALVNNAGYGLPGRFKDSPWEEHAAFLEVMVTSVAHMIHLFEPGMIERGYGRILNVASVAGMLPGTRGHTLYGASKAFLIRMSESLSAEHQDDNVHVTALCPGFTYTEFHDVAGNRAQVQKLPRALFMDAETVAEEGYDAVMKGTPVYVNGAVNRTITGVGRLIPGRLARTVVARQARKFRIERSPRRKNEDS